MEVSVAVVVEFRDGLMAAERFYWDAAGLARQLGAATLAVGGHAAAPAGQRPA